MFSEGEKVFVDVRESTLGRVTTCDTGKSEKSEKPASVPCCAQQTGMHILVVQALLIAIFLSEGRAHTYRHREI
jgi:hypothetical protein